MTERPWVLRSGAPSLENLEARVDQLHLGKLEELRANTGLSRVTLMSCLARGLESAEAVETFLNPRLEHLTSPAKIRDMDRAVVRLAEARRSQEEVLIFGDYDVDGTAGAALLSWTFREFGIRFRALQPDRFRDGYGLHPTAIREAHAQGIRLVVTVDCGVTSFEAIDLAGSLGMEVIVVDHHQIDSTKGLPRAFAVLNPQRPDCESGLKQLCGCGLAFYLAMGLRSHGRANGWFAGGTEPNLKRHLDLVVLATAADMVPLIGDNHILVRHGMEVLKHTNKPGLKALLRNAGVADRDVSPSHLGFVLGPRINASGRMQSASLALELLTTTEDARAQSLASELELINTERARVQNEIWDQVRARVEKGLSEGKFLHGIVVADAAWHEGVVGIVASRVTETFHRPAIVLGIRQHEAIPKTGPESKLESGPESVSHSEPVWIAKGSVRSYGGKDVLQALRASSRHLKGFGGHRHAAGVSLDPKELEEFSLAFDQALAAIEVDPQAIPLYYDATANISELNLATLRELERLGPFGPGNPEPVFRIRASATSRRTLKGRHLKLALTNTNRQIQSAPGDGSTLPGRIPSGTPAIEAIWFHAAEVPENLEQDFLYQETDWLGVPEINRYMGRVTPNLRLKARRVVQTSAVALGTRQDQLN